MNSDFECCKDWVKQNNLPFLVVENSFNCFCELQLRCAMGIDNIFISKYKDKQGDVKYGFVLRRQYYVNFSGKILEDKTYQIEQTNGFKTLQNLLSNLLEKPGLE